VDLVGINILSKSGPSHVCSDFTNHAISTLNLSKIKPYIHTCRIQSREKVGSRKIC